MCGPMLPDPGMVPVKRKVWASHYKSSAAHYIIVYDPICVEDGGYKKGSLFMASQVLFMLQGNIRGFTTGTILKDRHGHRFIIKDSGDQSCRLVLVPYCKEMDESIRS